MDEEGEGPDDLWEATEVPEADAADEVEGLERVPVGVPEETGLVPLDPYLRYIAEIKRYSLLTPEEELELATLYRQTNDSYAAFRLVTANLRLVVKIALEYQWALVSGIMDLIQEGNIGLMQAVKRFDPYRGVKLSTYAQWWIRAYILKYILDNRRLVRLNTTKVTKRLFFNLQREKAKLEAMGLTPGPRLLAEHLQVSEEEVTDMEQRLRYRELSLDQPIRDGFEGRLADLIASTESWPEERMGDAEFRAVVRGRLAVFCRSLNRKEQAIFFKRLFSDEPMTLQALGKELGISRERVRQIEKRLTEKLRLFLKQELPDLVASQEG